MAILKNEKENKNVSTADVTEDVTEDATAGAGVNERDSELREAKLRAQKAVAEVARLERAAGADRQAAPEAADDENDNSEGEAELRNDSMMAHLLDSLAAKKDIGHYGRLVFAMVARHFMPHEEVLGWLMRDSDFEAGAAEAMLRQVEGRDYNPPKRERIVEWQAEQDFPILPHPEDPDCGNLYRNLKFPNAIYDHIEHYQEQKIAAE